ncbi:hypothetical protein PCCS19_39920 [Paenibacillus sp. CCS19]|uniref:hypothetical protein n=1 Tax=Paenibacillus sp. CCS19 TaxID=3158387 RepID=UPI002562F6FD|nr:hypothetical protein [Paenibacillus cellulosilyticus]GMK40936.1 hypothetical protein PCCS19_39920 [Paenibacillus cellulosilyticus]
MKKGLLFFGMVFVLLPSLMSRTGIEMNDFTEGLMMGIGAVACVAGLLKAKITRQQA